MKIESLNKTDGNGCAKLRILVNGKERVRAGCLSEYPEDAMLERDLSFVYDIPRLMREAYEAGKAGELFEFYESDDTE